MFLFRYGKLSKEKQKQNHVCNKPRSGFPTAIGLHGEIIDFRAGAGNVPSEPGTSDARK